MTYNGSSIKVSLDGIGEVKFTANTVGKSSWTGIVTIKNRGRDTTFVIRKEYEVIEPLIQK